MIERLPLIQAPTPIHRLDHLSAEFGLDLWIKRDDLTGLALGGNKGRKLEYLMPQAIGVKADVVVTCGALQSNFIRQLGAACAILRIRCAAAVMRLPYEPVAGKQPSINSASGNGNVLLDEIFGVELHEFPNDTWEVLYDHAEQLAVTLEQQDLRVYRIPVGGSSGLGAFAFYEAAAEIARQTGPFDFIVTPTSSGSTQAGLANALFGSKTKLIGISADPEPDLVEDVLRVSDELHTLLCAECSPTLVRLLVRTDFDIRIDWAGPAYGVPSDAGNAAIRKLARTEGILLDPIYTGKAFAGLLDLAARDELSGRVLFWHTGGSPALFAV